jgi:hypothetical protein
MNEKGATAATWQWTCADSAITDKIESSIRDSSSTCRALPFVPPSFLNDNSKSGALSSCSLVHSTFFHSTTMSKTERPTSQLQVQPSMSSMSDEEQVVEAVRSLAEFQQGDWQGVARCFMVTPDVAAGVVQRTVSPEYGTSLLSNFPWPIKSDFR